MITSCREKLREMCAFSHASSAVAAPVARQYPVTSATVVAVRPMAADPLGSFGCFASRTAPGGGTNFPKIALASAAARCAGVPDGWLLTATVPEDSFARGAEVAVPQLTASIAPRIRRNGLVLLSLTPFRRQAPRRRFRLLARPAADQGSAVRRRTCR